MPSPILSVITVTYNVRDDIKPTLESIAKYKDDCIEVIVIDGNSTDGTQEVIKSFLGFIDVFVSEPDKGIYDAMNKAIDLANGQYLLYINTGDVLLKNPLAKITDYLQLNPYLILFNVALSNGKTFKNSISFKSKYFNTIHHQGVLYKNLKACKYDISYKAFGDFDLNQRILKNQDFNYIKIDDVYCYHDMGGLSHNKVVFNENYQIILKNQGYFYVVLSFLHFKYKGLISRIFKI